MKQTYVDSLEYVSITEYPRWFLLRQQRCSCMSSCGNTVGDLSSVKSCSTFLPVFQEALCGMFYVCNMVIFHMPLYPHFFLQEKEGVVQSIYYHIINHKSYSSFIFIIIIFKQCRFLWNYIHETQIRIHQWDSSNLILSIHTVKRFFNAVNHFDLHF